MTGSGGEKNWSLLQPNRNLRSLVTFLRSSENLLKGKRAERNELCPSLGTDGIFCYKYNYIGFKRTHSLTLRGEGMR